MCGSCGSIRSVEAHSLGVTLQSNSAPSVWLCGACRVLLAAVIPAARRACPHNQAPPAEVKAHAAVVAAELQAQISVELNRRRIPSPRGSFWHVGAVARAIANNPSVEADAGTGLARRQSRQVS